MIYKHEIEAFNEFWLDCDTEMLFSLLISKNEKYKVFAYRNDYHYIMLNAKTPSNIFFNEIRMIPDISALREQALRYIDRRKCGSTQEAIRQIKTHLRQGYYVMAGVDLYEWVEENMCYHNHHVEHYALINGYDDEQNVFFTMETDNEKYREFQVTEKQLSDAMSLEETLRYDVVAFEVREETLDRQLFTWKELKKNSQRIQKSIRPLLKNEFWIFTPNDYKNLFYRDMTVMYLMQINCRMKANRLLFMHLIEEGLDKEFYERADLLEKGWIDVRRSISKLYFKEDASRRIIEQNKKIHELLLAERDMWKQFISI